MNIPVYVLAPAIIQYCTTDEKQWPEWILRKTTVESINETEKILKNSLSFCLLPDLQHWIESAIPLEVDEKKAKRPRLLNASTFV
jgi:hypothetical protein